MNKPSPPRPNLKEMVERLREHASLLDMRPEDTLEWQAADLIDAQARVVAAAIALERGGQLCGENWHALRQAIRAMRGNAE